MSEPLLAVERLVAGYVRGLPIVHGVSITVAAGEVVTVIGPNGAGKSTLLKAIVGLVGVESGRVVCEGPAAMVRSDPRVLDAYLGEMPGEVPDAVGAGATA